MERKPAPFLKRIASDLLAKLGGESDYLPNVPKNLPSSLRQLISYAREDGSNLLVDLRREFGHEMHLIELYAITDAYIENMVQTGIDHSSLEPNQRLDLHKMASDYFRPIVIRHIDHFFNTTGLPITFDQALKMSEYQHKAKDTARIIDGQKHKFIPEQHYLHHTKIFIGLTQMTQIREEHANIFSSARKSPA